MILAPLPPGALSHVGRCRICFALILTMDGHTHMKWHGKNKHAAAVLPEPEVSDVGQSEEPAQPKAKRKRIHPSAVANFDLDKGMEKITEEWRAIPGWEGMYEVSNRGEVRSLPRTTKAGSEWKGRIMRANVGKGKRLRVVLSNAKTRDYRYIHELVREVFVGLPTAEQELAS